MKVNIFEELSIIASIIVVCAFIVFAACILWPLGYMFDKKRAKKEKEREMDNENKEAWR